MSPKEHLPNKGSVVSNSLLLLHEAFLDFITRSREESSYAHAQISAF